MQDMLVHPVPYHRSRELSLNGFLPQSDSTSCSFIGQRTCASIVQKHNITSKNNAKRLETSSREQEKDESTGKLETKRKDEEERSGEKMLEDGSN